MKNKVHLLISGLFVFYCLFSITPIYAINKTDSLDRHMSVWLESSLNKVFPQSPVLQRNSMSLLAARNSKISFQVAFHNQMKDQTQINCLVDGGDIQTQVRYVGLVPFPNFNTDVSKEEIDGIGYLPGMLPEPLYPVSKADATPYASRSFWITLTVPAAISPGEHECKVKLSWTEGKVQKQQQLFVKVNVANLVIKPRHDFHVTHWWRGEATALYYKTELYNERWWKLTRALMKNLIEHGNDVAFIQNFFELRAVFKKPCQMLIVNEQSPGKYIFDWTNVKRFVDMCRELGYMKFEWAHLWLYWGVADAMHVYTKKEDGTYRLLWDEHLKAMDPIYINFLKQYLPEFHRFLKKEKLLENSYFHLSDEPWSEHIENYKKARNLLHELAPWMKVMDALSDIRYGRDKLTDIPVPIISSAEDYLKEGIPHWVYYCTGPRGPWLNRFYDTPLAKIRMSGFLFYKLKAQGFLHWGYNFWYKLDTEQSIDPFNEGAATAYPGIAQGDPFVVYPGPDGPYDSIRWEVFAEALQDYAILQSAGISANSELLHDIKNYRDFPKQETWISSTMAKLLK
ncbi:DUF4091 domain-containing protein [Mucilaginibacter sp. 22184]|uniref:DUF4091 domain-containing protein n=1 Tax=Mucilaginibacter sp. 22184 TaxID=3453887 RepID=UPI003F84BA0F